MAPSRMMERAAGVFSRDIGRGRAAVLFGLALALLMGAACNAGGAPPTPTAESVTPTPTGEPSPPPEPSPAPERVVIDIQGFAFAPEEVTVPVGSSVTWVMRDRGTTHTVTIEDPATGEQFDEQLETGESFQYTFEQAGVFNYFCRIHPDTPAMRATVRVEAAG